MVTPVSATEVEVPEPLATAPAVPFSMTVARVVPVLTPLNSYILKYTSSEVLLPPSKVGAEVPVDRPIQRYCLASSDAPTVCSVIAVHVLAVPSRAVILVLPGLRVTAPLVVPSWRICTMSIFPAAPGAAPVTSKLPTESVPGVLAVI